MYGVIYMLFNKTNIKSTSIYIGAPCGHLKGKRRHVETMTFEYMDKICAL